MAELTSKPNHALHKKALEKATRLKNDYVVAMIRSMKPAKLSRADQDFLEHYLEQE